jgi:CheY-like chemotaxis protein
VALRQLAKLGYTADAVANGNEVLNAIARIPYDVILMDCQMPDLDGYETTRRIRLEQSRHIHIIAMTAHAMQGDREKCIEAGMDDYVTKPVKVEHLHAALLRSREHRPPETGLVDLAQLRDASDGDPAEMQALAETYLEQADEILPELAAAVEANSAYDLNRLAHKLAGSSASCGMIAMVPVLRELEQIGQQGDLSSASASFERASQALHRTRRYLTLHLLAGGDAAPESRTSPALS